MRALRFDAAVLRLHTNVPEPSPAPGEALIRTRRVGISPADVRTAQGRSRFTGTLGHEFVGVVEAVNLPTDAPPALLAKRSLKGKRVVGSPNILCSACDMCRSGLAQHCRHRQVIGVHARDGCMADFFTLPLANLHVVPDNVDDDRAALAEPLACALHSAHMIRAEAKTYITVLGDTLMGLITAQALTRLNKSVRMLGSRPDRARLCEKWSIKHRMIDEAGRRQDQDVVIDCTGSSLGLRLAMQLVRPRGTILLKSAAAAAPLPPGVPFPNDTDPNWSKPVDLTPLIVNEVQVLGSRDGSIPDALALLETNQVDVVPLISRRFKLDDAPTALRAAADPEQLKVLIEI